MWIFHCFAELRGDSGNLAPGMLGNVPCTVRQVVSYVKKMTWNGHLEENTSAVGGGGKSTWSEFTLSCQYRRAANVTNASFKSSKTLLACEPSERASKETATVLVHCSRIYGPPCKWSAYDVKKRNAIHYTISPTLAGSEWLKSCLLVWGCGRETLCTSIVEHLAKLNYFGCHWNYRAGWGEGGLGNKSPSPPFQD